MSVQKRCAYCACGITRPASVEDVHVPPDSCIPYLADRIAKLEAKLGAADVGLSTDREAVAERPITASSPPAAPSTYWSEEAGAVAASRNAPIIAGRIQIAVWPEKLDELVRLHRFAAAVTRWYETPGCNDSDEADLMDIVGAFVRGEKLPEVGT